MYHSKSATPVDDEKDFEKGRIRSAGDNDEDDDCDDDADDADDADDDDGADDDDSLTQNEDPCKDEQLWDYLEATTKGIFRNKTGLVADIKGSVGPEVTMLSE